MAYKKSFTKVKVSGQTDVEADVHSDELTFAGSGVTITTSGDTVTFTASGGGGSSDSISDSDGDTKIQVEESSDEDKIRFDTAGTQRMVITDSGKIGIGVDAPGYKVDIDGDIRVRGNDIRDNGGNAAITMDGSANTKVNNTLTVDGDGSSGGVTVTDGNIDIRTGTGSVAKIDMYCESSNAHKVSIKAPAHSEYSGDVNFTLPPSNGTNGQALVTDGSGNTSWSTVSGGGGSSKDTFAIRLAGVFAVSSTNTNRMFVHLSGMGNAMGGSFNYTATHIGNTSNTTFTTTARQAASYYTIAVMPFACTMDSVSLWAQWRYTYTNPPKYRVWKGTYTEGTAGDVTWTQLFDAENCADSSTTSTADAIGFKQKSLSSGNTFAAGDIVCFSFETGGSSSSSTNQFTATMMCTET